MPPEQGPGATAATVRAVMDANAYLTLATADADGVPWASPVWFAHDGFRELFWVSDPDARHSRNIAVRPEVGIVVFDSHVPMGTGQGVYLVAVAGQAEETELERGLDVFSRRSLEQGGRAWTAADVQPPARHRLYRAKVHQHHLGGRDDRRMLVDLGAGSGSS